MTRSMPLGIRLLHSLRDTFPARIHHHVEPGILRGPHARGSKRGVRGPPRHGDKARAPLPGKEGGHETEGPVSQHQHAPAQRNVGGDHRGEGDGERLREAGSPEVHAFALDETVAEN